MKHDVAVVPMGEIRKAGEALMLRKKVENKPDVSDHWEVVGAHIDMG